jgi:hypothetical protein
MWMATPDPKAFSGIRLAGKLLLCAKTLAGTFYIFADHQKRPFTRLSAYAGERALFC